MLHRQYQAASILAAILAGQKVYLVGKAADMKELGTETGARNNGVGLVVHGNVREEGLLARRCGHWAMGTCR